MYMQYFLLFFILDFELTWLLVCTWHKTCCWWAAGWLLSLQATDNWDWWWLEDDDVQLRQEVLEAYRQLQRLQLEVEGRHDEWSPETVDITDLHAGQLLTALTQLRTLVHRRLRLSSTMLFVSHTVQCSHFDLSNFFTLFCLCIDLYTSSPLVRVAGWCWPEVCGSQNIVSASVRGFWPQIRDYVRRQMLCRIRDFWPLPHRPQPQRCVQSIWVWLGHWSTINGCSCGAWSVMDSWLG